MSRTLATGSAAHRGPGSASARTIAPGSSAPSFGPTRRRSRGIAGLGLGLAVAARLARAFGATSPSTAEQATGNPVHRRHAERSAGVRRPDRRTDGSRPRRPDLAAEAFASTALRPLVSSCHAEFRRRPRSTQARAGSLETSCLRVRQRGEAHPTNLSTMECQDHETPRFPDADRAGRRRRVAVPERTARPSPGPRLVRPMRRSASPASAWAARATATPTTPARTARSSPSATSTTTPSTRWRAKYPKAKKYFDYRKMLEELGDKIDAVTVSTPDHTHAPASVMAMRMGKHCFCQKPLTWSVEEARVMRDARRREEALHPDGQPGHGRGRLPRGRRADPLRASSGRSRRSTSGPTGRSGRRASAGPRTRRASPTTSAGTSSSAPPTTGPTTRLPPVQLARLARLRHRRPGRHGLPHDQRRRAWPWSCSIPSRVEVVDTSGIVDRETYPVWSIIRTQFGQRNGRGPLTMTWYDGGEKLPEDKRAYKEHALRREGPRQRPAPGRREGLVLLPERLRRRARPAAPRAVQGRQEARADPAPLARPLHRVGRGDQGERAEQGRCRTSTTPAG